MILLLEKDLECRISPNLFVFNREERCQVLLWLISAAKAMRGAYFVQLIDIQWRLVSGMRTAV